MADIKLFVCCHQPTDVPKHPLLFPVQAGVALANHRFPGFLYDDDGDNISKWNRSYCELTVQYWAWKNMQADYYGFFHYRRYLYPDFNARHPYRIECTPSTKMLEHLKFERFPHLIETHDVILPKGENMYLPVQEHYASAAGHHRKDLELVREIVTKRYPEMTLALEHHLSNTVCYFGNIFIMSRSYFEDYCAWLFPILQEFDQRADISNRSGQECRVDGYLSERLLGVYTSFRTGKTIELPRVHFYPLGQFLQHRALNTLLPPGSRRRATIKQLVEHI